MFELMRRNNNQQINSYDPFREIEDLECAFFGAPFGSFFEPRTALSAFRTDVTDEGDHYLLEADLPGFDKKDIHLDLTDDTLTIQAERHSKVDETDKKNRYVHMERSYGSYSRRFDVSQIDTENIRAAYDNGVLKLTLPKKSQIQPAARRLEIE